MDRMHSLGHRLGIPLLAPAMVLVLASCAAPPQRVGTLLTPSDRTIIVEMTNEALETAKSGESRNWENPATGRHGNVTPQNSFTGKAERPCRDFQQTLGHDNTTTTAYDRACRNKEGGWISLYHPDLAGALARAPVGGISYGPDPAAQGIVLEPSVHFGVYHGHYGHRHYGYGHGGYGYYGYGYPYYGRHYPYFRGRHFPRRHYRHRHHPRFYFYHGY